MMNETFEARIGKYLAGESSASEKEALEALLQSDPALRDEFQALRRIWETKAFSSDPTWDTDKAWQRFSLSKQSRPTVQTSKNRTRVLSWAVAAVVMLALGAAVFLWNAGKPVHYAFDETNNGQLTLADGSRIFLNKGATVDVFPFKKDKRKVELSGEAFFEISPDPNRPFIVIAGETVTEVVGTSFNIDHQPEQTSIFVKSGKVIFRAQKNDAEALALTSGEAAIFTKDKIQPVINPSPNLHSWHSKELHFREMPLADVIADVESYFNQKITIENENIKKCPITFALPFKEPEFDSVVEAIAVAVNANVSMQNNKCIIKGGVNCH